MTISSRISQFTLPFAFVMACGPARAPVQPADLVPLLLAGDWQAVVDACGSLPPVPASPEVRAALGHACLLTNRNTDSTWLFLSLDEPARQAWHDWTSELAAQAPTNSVAATLQADALARLGRADDALAAYDRALELSPSAAAYLGRASVEASLARWDAARASLEAGVVIDSDLAEAHASLGCLQLARRAARGAGRSFERALELSPSHPLARNGLGCARYGLSEWEQAEADFLQASREIDLDLFAGNRRALAVSQERLLLAEPDDSPWFRWTDVLDWVELRELSLDEGSAIHVLHGGPLPDELDYRVIMRLDEGLASEESTGCLVAVISRAIGEAGVQEALAAASVHSAAAAEGGHERTAHRNRRLVELGHPRLIASHVQRNPGMQLDIVRRFTTDQDYKHGLSADKLVMGQARMDNIYRPMANGLESTRVPVLKFIGNQWNGHMDESTRTNRVAMDRRGLDLDEFRPAGVTTRLRQGFVDDGRWPVTSWMGLLHDDPYSSSITWAGEGG
jgi:hypothetical protein